MRHRSDRAAAGGVRFRVFTQPPVVSGFETPETMTLSSPRGGIGIGPTDHRFRTLMPAVAKPRYAPPESLPPYLGPTLLPAIPDRLGHFDNLPEDTPEFRAAHVYAVARITLDVWEHYRNREIPWAFHFERMELIPEIDWANAHSGYGFIELGHNSKRDDGVRIPYWQNFDVIAHEVGHAILFSLMPLPAGSEPTRDCLAFYESGCDLIAILAAMHSERLLWHVLEATSGDIYGLNELNRLGEISEIEQVRLACNDLHVRDVQDDKLHRYSLPVTGALFDILVLAYLQNLSRLRAMPRAICNELLAGGSIADVFPRLHEVFVRLYPRNRLLFFRALMDARDYLGRLLASAFERFNPARLSYLSVGNAILDANVELTGGRDQGELAEIFLWRGIGTRYINI